MHRHERPEAVSVCVLECVRIYYATWYAVPEHYLLTRENGVSDKA